MDDIDQNSDIVGAQSGAAALRGRGSRDTAWHALAGEGADDTDPTRANLHLGSRPDWGVTAVTIDDPRFEIAEGRVRLRDDAVIDAATEPRISLDITTTGAGGLVRTDTVVLDTIEVLSAPDIGIRVPDGPDRDTPHQPGPPSVDAQETAADAARGTEITGPPRQPDARAETTETALTGPPQKIDPAGLPRDVAQRPDTATEAGQPEDTVDATTAQGVDGDIDVPTEPGTERHVPAPDLGADTRDNPVSTDHPTGDKPSMPDGDTPQRGQPPTQATAATGAAAAPSADPVPSNAAPTGITLDPRPHFGDTATLTVRLGGEAYRGDPDYEILVDGEKVAAGTVTWARDTAVDGAYETRGANGDVNNDAVVWRDVTLDVPVPEGGFGKVEVRFPNDAYRAGVGDRNLIVDHIGIDGHRIEAESSAVDYIGAKSYDPDMGAERMPWRGTLSFDTSPVFADATFGAAAAPGPSVTENVEGATIGRIRVRDPDGHDSHTLRVSDARFEVDGHTLKLRDGVSLDAEDADRVDVDVVARDAGGLEHRETLSIQVTDVNEAPDDIVVSATGLPEDDLVLWLDGQDRDGDFAPDAIGDASRGVWVDKSGAGSTGALDGNAPTVTDTGLDFADTGAGYRISGNSDLNRGTFTEKSFALSFETGADVSGVQMIYEQGGTVRGYSLSIAPDPDTGDPTLWGLAYNRAEWDGDHQHKPVNLGPAEPGRFYSVALVHDATDPDPAARTFSGYVNGKLVDRADHVDVQFNHPDAAGIGNLNNGTVLAHDATPFRGDIPFKGEISEAMSWNRALTPDEIAGLDGHLAANRVQVADGVNVLESAEPGDIVATLSAHDPDAGDTLSYRLVDETGNPVDDPRFVIDGNTIRLKPDAMLDRETDDTHALRVQVTDSGGLSRTETLSVRVLDVDEAPTDIRLDVTEIDDTLRAGSVVATLDATDPEGAAIVSYDIVGAADRRIDHDLFEIDGDALRLRDGITLDATDTDSVALRIQAVDLGGNIAYRDITLNIVDGNQAPTGIDIATSTVRGDTPGAAIGAVRAIDPDDGDAHDFSVSDARFAIHDGVLGLRPDVVLDPADGPFSVDITATDRFGESVTETVTLDVADALPVTVASGFRTEIFARPDGAADPGDIDWSAPPSHAMLTQTPGEADMTAPDGGDGFAARITGWIEVQDSGDYTFQTGEAKGLQLFIDGVPLDGAALQEGATHHLEPGPHRIEMRFLGDAGDAAPRLDWDGPGLDGPVPLSAAPGLVADTNGTLSVSISIDAPDAALPGFRASYFDMDERLSRLDQVDWDGTPDHAETVDRIDYTNGRGSFWEGGSADTFAARVQGEIAVETGGTYEFHLGADDGAMLYVDGAPVLDNDGLHAFRTRTASVDLEPGQHEIEVRYFENFGHAGLKLEWDGPDTDGRESVTAAPATPDAAAADLRTELTGLPPDTLLMAGDRVAISNGGPLDVSEWDLSLVDIAPPPGFEGQIDWAVRQTDATGETRDIALSETFPIVVGNPDAAHGAADPDPFSDIANDMMQADTGWADDPGDPAPPADDDAVAAADDDVLSEDVAMAAAETEAQDMVDTHERHDW